MNRRERMTIELKDDLGQALVSLMREKPVDKITVEYIITSASASRASFYRHFKDKEKLLSYELLRQWARYATEHSLLSTDASRERDQLFFEFIYSSREENQLVMEAGCESCISEAIWNAFEGIQQDEDPHEYYRDCFRASGLSGLTIGWIKAGYDLTVDQMADLAAELFDRL